MLRDLRTALARRRKRERLRRQYMAALSLDDRLLRDAGLLPAMALPLVQPQVLSDTAIDERITLALVALTSGVSHGPS